ncbi:MAG TPA: NADP-dependent oxidoreductase [Candidatus Acidoferrum sp.]|nr:NADP-dependent oxidoreductase [Candidatus Acidoferrum sp.]
MIPETMKAAVIDKAGPPDALRVASVPTPKLKDHHVIIALDYASVGIWDARQRSGAYGPLKPGTILGADGSGTVAAVASGVTRLRVGDRVYSYSYGNPDGGFHAEYVSVPANRVERVPEQLDQKVAGAMPCVALTAHAGLHVLKMKIGDALLVFGATGGVGSFAVWLAANAIGATVAGTARADAQAYLRDLGGTLLSDGATNAFDAMFATASGSDLAALASHLKPKAPIAFPNGIEPEPKIDGHPSRPFDGEMSREAFERLNTAIGTRTIPLKIEEFSLDRVADAHRRIEQGHVEGKIVLRIR